MTSRKRRILSPAQREEALEETTEAAVRHWEGLDRTDRENAVNWALTRLNSQGTTRAEALSTAIRLEWEEGTEEGKAFRKEQIARRAREQQEWRDRPLSCSRCREATDPRGRLVFSGESGEDQAFCYRCTIRGQEPPFSGIVELVHREAVRRGLPEAR